MGCAPNSVRWRFYCGLILWQLVMTLVGRSPRGSLTDLSLDSAVSTSTY
ncbi:MAG: hypothetical protein ACFCBU_01010 [Cyanophyceae cyanobacterium]